MRSHAAGFKRTMWHCSCKQLLLTAVLSHTLQTITCRVRSASAHTQMCETGGTIKPTTNFMTGKTSRSLKAAYRAVDEKLAPKVAHLDGGIFAWCACPACA